MHKTIFLLTFLMTNLQAFCQDDIRIVNEVKGTINPLDTLVFDEIVACNINFDSLRNRRTLDQTNGDASKYDLSPRTTSSIRNVDSSMFREVVQLFSDTATYGQNYADCFEPRFVLQFKNKGEERFRIIICEGCGYLISTVPIPSAYKKYYDIEIENDGEKAIYRRYLKGFSETGTLKVNKLCKTLNLGYCQTLHDE